MRRAKDYYHLVYYVLCRVGLLDDPQERKWKGLIAVAVLQVTVLIALGACLEAAAGVSWLLDLPRPAIAAICLAAFALNYWGLLHRDRWKAFAAAFERLTADEQRRGIRTAWVIIAVVAVASLIPIALLRPAAAG